jgi:branched-chain amino acid transport system permease protein
VSQLPQYIASGLTIGAIYALVGIGFSISYASSGVLNFAQGEYVMLGGIVAASLNTAHHVALPLAILAALVLTSGVGAMVGWAVTKLSRLTEMQLGVATLALATAIEAGALAVWGTDQRSLRPLAGSHLFHWLDATVTPSMLTALGLGLVATFGIEAFLRRTRWGRAMLATATHRAAAGLLGISPVVVTVIAFAIAGFVGGLGGVAITPISAISYVSGFTIALNGFAAAVLGGMGSVSGALYGGLILGLISGVGGAYVPTGYADALPLLVLIVALVVRPQGLRGRVARVV